MAPAKKKNSRYKNKLLDYNSLCINDVLCPICRTIVIEPVSLPCQHLFCLCCFNCTIENNSLCCPICRLRIGSWLRSSSKSNTVINSELWEYVKTNFKNEVEAKANGHELTFSNTNEPVKLKLSEPGEIRQEYEKQLSAQQQIYRSEREKETKLSQELIQKLQEEENSLKLENEKRLKRDAELAKELANAPSSQTITTSESVENETSVKASQDASPSSDIIRHNNLINKSLLNRVRSRAVLATVTGKSDILYRYDYNVKNVQNNNVGKDSSIQVNMSNSHTVTSQQKKPAAAISKYGCLIKSYSKKSSQGHDISKSNANRIASQVKSPKASQDKNFMAKGSARTQQLHAMSLLRQLGQTYSEHDEDAKKQDSITQELCHFRPIKSAVVTKRRTLNGKQLRQPLVYSPPRKPIARNSKHTVNSKTILSIKGAKILTYSGSKSAFAAYPTVYLCANLIITTDDNEDDEIFTKTDKNTTDNKNTPSSITSNKWNTGGNNKTKTYSAKTHCRKRLFDKTIKEKNVSLKKTKIINNSKKIRENTIVPVNGDIAVIKNSGDLEDFENFERLTVEQREKLVQEKKDLELAKRLQEYLNQFDSDDSRSYGLRKDSSSSSKYSSSRFVNRGTRTSPRKRQTTLDAIFFSTEK